MTIDLIVQTQAYDEQAVVNLIEKFSPILKKYAYKLYYDDAYNDLVLDFIELVLNIKLNNFQNKSEASIISYILVSIHASYIKRSKALKNVRNFIVISSLSERELYYIETKSSVCDSYNNLFADEIKKVLTKQEFETIALIYIYGFSACEIAKSFKISRQAVNQTKNRAIQKIRNYYNIKTKGGCKDG